MRMQTKNFGWIEFLDEKVIIFDEGIPGFRQLKSYILIEDETQNSPFAYLQSTEDGNICFIILNPYAIKKDYIIDVKEQYIEALGGGNMEQFSVFVIVTALSDFESATINLIAPIIIQNETRKGMQVILENTSYQTKHKIVELMKEGDC